jgi:hypothetical protein
MRHSAIALLSASAVALSLAGCASTAPASPQVAVMPAKGKSFQRFQRDDDYCQAAAQQSVGYASPGQAANDQTVAGAAVGTAVGALAGAAIGAASGNAGVGAAIGAGTGLAGGAIVGGANGRAAGGSIQARYDTVYAQCMSTKGNRVMAPNAPPPPVLIVEEPEPVFVSPRPYYWGPDYVAPPYYYRRGWW